MTQISVTLNGDPPAYPINLPGTQVGHASCSLLVPNKTALAQFAVVWHQAKSPPIWQVIHLGAGAHVGSFKRQETALNCAKQLDDGFDLSGVTRDSLQSWRQANSSTLHRIRDLVEDCAYFEEIYGKEVYDVQS